MKNKTPSESAGAATLALFTAKAIGIAIILCTIAAVLTASLKGSDFSGPEKLALPNVHQPRSDWNFLVWYQGAGREWLRISGDSSAPDLAAQWRPGVVLIETTHEPVIVKTEMGWQIQFK